jgi:predicted lipid-binding transport protein (Tim44 family)
MILSGGSRGLRSRAAPARPACDVRGLTSAPVSIPVIAVSAPLLSRVPPWIVPIIGLVAGTLIGNVLFGILGADAHAVMVLPVDVGVALLVLGLLALRRQRSARADGARQPSRDRARPVAVPELPVTVEDDPRPASDLDNGVRDIRETDPGFDPTRFAGYTGMIFRDAHTAWMRRDIASLRQRLTPEMYGALVAQCERLRDARRSNRVEAVEIQTEITEAWQESGRDFVTAYIVGSMIDYTVDDASDASVEGSRTIPRDVNEFWTFTRPAGLNFWMLSAIQTS